MSTPPPTGPLVTQDTFAATCAPLGVEPGETLLVHSSLSSLGWVCGGAVAVVQGLLDALGPEGTLVVPTQTGDLSDPALLEQPAGARGVVGDDPRAPCPRTTPAITPTRGVGVIPETVRTWPGALRSATRRPRSPRSARARRRSSTGHAPDCRLGERSPLARLEDARRPRAPARRGLRHVHQLPPRRVPDPVPAGRGAAGRGPTGWEVVTEVSIDSDRFDELGHDFERDRPVVRGKVGAADVRLFPVADAVAYAERWLPRAPAPRGGDLTGPARAVADAPAVGARAYLDSGAHAK